MNIRCRISRLAFLLLTLLPGLSAVVRAEGDPKLESRIAAAIEQLGCEEFQVRERAGKLLVDLGEEALPIITHASLEHEDIEVRLRVRRIVGEIIQRVAVSHATGVKTLLIQPAIFNMGSPQSESGRQSDEVLHRVQITRPFLIGKFEVSQRQYELVTNRRPSWFRPGGKGQQKIESLDTRAFPVEQVSWFDAIDFCNRLSEMDQLPAYYRLQVDSRAEDPTQGGPHAMTEGAIIAGRVEILGGNGYRLPTEAEWEFACRASAATAFSFGVVRSGAPGNFKYQVRTSYGSRTTTKPLERTAKCGSYPPNPWGLYDMHGNVGEWCWDIFETDYYSRSPHKDPHGPDTGQHRVLRGGSWLVSQSGCRSASRFWLPAGETKYVAGFRVARTLKWSISDP